MTMRSRFYRLATEALEDDERVAVVLAAIGASEIPEHPRRFDVGIREQLDDRRRRPGSHSRATGRSCTRSRRSSSSGRTSR